MRWFLLRARARDGQILYYTGKPFGAWISPNKDEAFRYEDMALARHRAEFLNRGERTHGLWFKPVAVIFYS